MFELKAAPTIHDEYRHDSTKLGKAWDNLLSERIEENETSTALNDQVVGR